MISEKEREKKVLKNERKVGWMALGHNQVLCELRKSTKNLNQSLKNIITKVLKLIYQPHTRKQRSTLKHLSLLKGKL